LADAGLLVTPAETYLRDLMDALPEDKREIEFPANQLTAPVYRLAREIDAPKHDQETVENMSELGEKADALKDKLADLLGGKADIDFICKMEITPEDPMTEQFIRHTKEHPVTMAALDIDKFITQLPGGMADRDDIVALREVMLPALQRLDMAPNLARNPIAYGGLRVAIKEMMDAEAKAGVAAMNLMESLAKALPDEDIGPIMEDVYIFRQTLMQHSEAFLREASGCDELDEQRESGRKQQQRFDAAAEEAGNGKMADIISLMAINQIPELLKSLLASLKCKASDDCSGCPHSKEDTSTSTPPSGEPVEERA
jgi:hypothetical protein